MIKKIVFTGKISRMYPDGIEVCASNPAEALTALENYPGFLTENGRPIYTVALPDFPSLASLYQNTDCEVLQVEEVTEGAGGKGGFLQIIIGVVLIAVAMYTGQPWLANGALTFMGQVGVAGAMMIMGGILQMLMPQPQMSVNSNDPRSNYLPANKNTTAIGTPVPLLFGQRRVWPHILSYNVTATNLGTSLGLGTTPVGASGAVGNSEYDIVYEDWSNLGVGGA